MSQGAQHRIKVGGLDNRRNDDELWQLSYANVYHKKCSGKNREKISSLPPTQHAL